MSDRTRSGRFALPATKYRWVDRITKLAGVALIAGGLEAGGGTVTGVALGALGVAVGLSTVVINKQ